MKDTRLLQKLKNPTWPLSFALGGLVGFAVFLAFFGFGVLNPLSSSWLFDYHPDPPVAYLGWLGYRYGDWQLPFFGLSTQLTYPSAVSVIFTDSIPLLALPAKLLSFMLPRSFHYFGLWIAFCFVMQGGLAALMARKITPKLWLAAVMPGFFCLAPIFIQRIYIHIALGGQWVLLVCLVAWLYLDKFESFKRLLLLCIGLSLLAVLVHQYYVPMVFCLMAGMLVNHMLRYKASWRQPVAFFSAAAAGVFTIFMLGGFFGVSGASLTDKGLGENSANLNTFFDSRNAFAYLHGRPSFPMQYEGQAYLGAGLLALALVALALAAAKGWGLIRQKRLKSWLAAHPTAWLMAAAGLLLFLFALSPVVTLGDKILFTVPLPEALSQLLSIYRNTGRFAWPAVYIITFGVFKLLVTYLDRRFAVVLATLALALQMGDMAPFYNTTGAIFRQEHAHITSAAPLEAVSEEYDELLIASPAVRGLPQLNNLVYHALRKGDLRVNGALVYHIDDSEINAYRSEALAELEAGTIRQNTIYVYARGDELPQTGLYWYRLDDELILGLPRPTDALSALE